MKIIIKLKKLIAILTTTSLMISFVVGPSLANAINNDSNADKYKQIFNDFILPYSYGKITKAHFAQTDRVVINIQDLHCHPQVQKNISNIIETFDKNYGVNKIYLEGAYGKVSTEWINRAFSNYKILLKSLDKMIENGRLTGAEYYSIKSGKTEIINGLEEKEPYLENLKRFGKIIENQEKIDLILKEIENSTKKLKEKYYSVRQHKLEELFRQYKNGKISSHKYYAILSKHIDKLGIDLTKYENTLIYIKLLELQKNLDYSQIAKEFQNLISTLKQQIPYTIYKFLLDNTNNFKEIEKLYSYIMQLSREYNFNISLNFKELDKYFRYIELSKKINPIELVKEDELLEQEINTRFSQTKAEQDVVFLTHFEKYLKDYVTSKITLEDYKYYKNNISQYKKIYNKYIDNRVLSLLDDYIAQADKFYEINIDRNEYFTKNMFEENEKLNKIDNVISAKDDVNKIIDNMSKVKKLDVVITGGFHSQSVTELLEKQGVSYIVITPNVTDGIKLAEETYYALVREQSKIEFQTIAPVIASLSPELQNVLLQSVLTPQEIQQVNALDDKERTKLISDLVAAKILESDDIGNLETKLQEIVKAIVDEQYKQQITPELLSKIKNLQQLLQNKKKLQKAIDLVQSNTTKQAIKVVADSFDILYNRLNAFIIEFQKGNQLTTTKLDLEPEKKKDIFNDFKNKGVKQKTNIFKKLIKNFSIKFIMIFLALTTLVSTITISSNYKYIDRFSSTSEMYIETSTDEIKKIDNEKSTEIQKGLNEYQKHYSDLNLTEKEIYEFILVFNYTSDSSVNYDAGTTFEAIIKQLTYNRTDKIFFEILASDTFETMFDSHQYAEKYQAAVTVNSYIHYICYSYGIDINEISKDDLMFLINTIIEEYDSYYDQVKDIVLFNKDTRSIGFYSYNWISNYRGHPAIITPHMFESIMNKLGQSSSNRQTFRVYSPNEAEERKSEFLDSIANMYQLNSEEKIVVTYVGHGEKKGLLVCKDVFISPDEIATALIQAHNNNNLNLNNVILDLGSCYSYFISTKIYSILEARDIKEKPIILASAGYDTVYAPAYTVDEIMNTMFQKQMMDNLGDKTELRISDFYDIQFKKIAANSTIFIPLTDDYYEQLKEKFMPIVLKYSTVETAINNAELLPDQEDAILPLNVFLYSIFSKEQNVNLHEKASIWEEIVFRAVPSVIAAMYNEENGLANLNINKDIFIYAHAMSIWIRNDDEIQNKISFEKLLEDTKTRMMLGTNTITAIYEQAIEISKNLTISEKRAKIIETTLKAIGLHEAYNRGLISKKELEDGTYDNEIIKTVINSLKITEDIVWNLIEQSLNILGYMDTKVEKKLIDMQKAYDQVKPYTDYNENKRSVDTEQSLSKLRDFLKNIFKKRNIVRLLSIFLTSLMLMVPLFNSSVSNAENNNKIQTTISSEQVINTEQYRDTTLESNKDKTKTKIHELEIPEDATDRTKTVLRYINTQIKFNGNNVATMILYAENYIYLDLTVNELDGFVSFYKYCIEQEHMSIDLFNKTINKMAQNGKNKILFTILSNSNFIKMFSKETDNIKFEIALKTTEYLCNFYEDYTTKNITELSLEEISNIISIVSSGLKEYILNYSNLKLTLEEEREFVLFHYFVLNRQFVNGFYSIEELLNQVTYGGTTKLLFTVLANPELKQKYTFDQNKERFQIGMGVAEYIYSFCKQIGNINIDDISDKDMSIIIRVVFNSYINEMEKTGTKILIDKNTSVVGFAAHNFYLTNITIEKFLDLCGQNPENRVFIKVNELASDSLERKQEYFEQIKNSIRKGEKTFIIALGHGYKGGFATATEDNEYYQLISSREIVDILIEMHNEGYDLTKVSILLENCNGSFSAIQMFNMLKDVGIEILPIIISEESVYTYYGYHSTMSNYMKYRAEDIALSGKNNYGFTVSDFDIVQNQVFSNPTIFIPIGKEKTNYIKEQLGNIVSKYISDKTIETDKDYSDMISPNDIFTYNIFSKEQNRELNEKASIWEEIVFRAIPSVLQVLYGETKENFSVYQKAFMYAHAISKWVSNDNNVRENMSFNELIKIIEKELGKGTSTLANIYEDAIKSVKKLNSEKTKQIIIEATLKAIGLHEAYNRGLISKKELEDGTYDNEIIKTVINSLKITEDIVWNLIEQSLNILGYMDTKVEKKLIDMQKVYKELDSYSDDKISMLPLMAGNKRNIPLEKEEERLEFIENIIKLANLEESNYEHKEFINYLKKSDYEFVKSVYLKLNNSNRNKYDLLLELLSVKLKDTLSTKKQLSQISNSVQKGQHQKTNINKKRHTKKEVLKQILSILLVICNVFISGSILFTPKFNIYRTSIEYTMKNLQKLSYFEINQLFDELEGALSNQSKNTKNIFLDMFFYFDTFSIKQQQKVLNLFEKYIQNLNFSIKDKNELFVKLLGQFYYIDTKQIDYIFSLFEFIYDNYDNKEKFEILYIMSNDIGFFSQEQKRKIINKVDEIIQSKDYIDENKYELLKSLCCMNNIDILSMHNNDASGVSNNELMYDLVNVAMTFVNSVKNENLKTGILINLSCYMDIISPNQVSNIILSMLDCLRVSNIKNQKKILLNLLDNIQYVTDVNEDGVQLKKEEIKETITNCIKQFIESEHVCFNDKYDIVNKIISKYVNMLQGQQQNKELLDFFEITSRYFIKSFIGSKSNNLSDIEKIEVFELTKNNDDLSDEIKIGLIEQKYKYKLLATVLDNYYIYDDNYMKQISAIVYDFITKTQGNSIGQDRLYTLFVELKDNQIKKFDISYDILTLRIFFNERFNKVGDKNYIDAKYKKNMLILYRYAMKIGRDLVNEYGENITDLDIYSNINTILSNVGNSLAKAKTKTILSRKTKIFMLNASDPDIKHTRFTSKPMEYILKLLGVRNPKKNIVEFGFKGVDTDDVAKENKEKWLSSIEDYSSFIIKDEQPVYVFNGHGNETTLMINDSIGITADDIAQSLLNSYQNCIKSENKKANFKELQLMFLSCESYNFYIEQVLPKLKVLEEKSSLEIKYPSVVTCAGLEDPLGYGIKCNINNKNVFVSNLEYSIIKYLENKGKQGEQLKKLTLEDIFLSEIYKSDHTIFIPKYDGSVGELQKDFIVEKLTKIGNSKLIKKIYKDKAGENFRYTKLGVAIGVLLETREINNIFLGQEAIEEFLEQHSSYKDGKEGTQKEIETGLIKILARMLAAFNPKLKYEDLEQLDKKEFLIVMEEVQKTIPTLFYPKFIVKLVIITILNIKEHINWNKLQIKENKEYKVLEQENGKINFDNLIKRIYAIAPNINSINFKYPNEKSKAEQEAGKLITQQFSPEELEVIDLLASTIFDTIKYVNCMHDTSSFELQNIIYALQNCLFNDNLLPKNDEDLKTHIVSMLEHYVEVSKQKKGKDNILVQTINSNKDLIDSIADFIIDMLTKNNGIEHKKQEIEIRKKNLTQFIENVKNDDVDTSVVMVCSANENRSAIWHIMFENFLKRTNKERIKVFSAGVFYDISENEYRLKGKAKVLRDDYFEILNSDDRYKGIEDEIKLKFKSKYIDYLKLPKESRKVFIVAGEQHRAQLIKLGYDPSWIFLMSEFYTDDFKQKFKYEHKDLGKELDENNIFSMSEFPDPFEKQILREDLPELVKSLVEYNFRNYKEYTFIPKTSKHLVIELQTGEYYSFAFEDLSNNGLYPEIFLETIMKNNNIYSFIQEESFKGTSKFLEEKFGLRIQMMVDNEWYDIDYFDINNKTQHLGTKNIQSIRIIPTKKFKDGTKYTFIQEDMFYTYPVNSKQDISQKDENLDKIKQLTGKNSHESFYLEDFCLIFKNEIKDKIREAIKNNSLFAIYPSRETFNIDNLTVQEIYNRYKYISDTIFIFSEIFSEVLQEDFGIETSTIFFMKEILKNAFGHGNKYQTNLGIYIDVSVEKGMVYKVKIYNAKQNMQVEDRLEFLSSVSCLHGFHVGNKYLNYSKVTDENEKEKIKNDILRQDYKIKLDLLDYSEDSNIVVGTTEFFESTINILSTIKEYAKKVKTKISSKYEKYSIPEYSNEFLPEKVDSFDGLDLYEISNMKINFDGKKIILEFSDKENKKYIFDIENISILDTDTQIKTLIDTTTLNKVKNILSMLQNDGINVSLSSDKNLLDKIIKSYFTLDSLRISLQSKGSYPNMTLVYPYDGTTPYFSIKLKSKEMKISIDDKNIKEVITEDLLEIQDKISKILESEKQFNINKIDEYYYWQDVIDFEKTVATFEYATDLGRKENGGRQEGMYVDLQGYEGEVIVIGDIHADLLKVMQKISANREKLDKGEAIIVFEGDYIHNENNLEEMDSSIATLEFIMDLKIAYPQSVYLLAGNHDVSDKIIKGKDSIFQSKLFYSKIKELYGEEAVERLKQILKNNLAIVAEGDDFIVIHGGPIKFSNWRQYLKTHKEIIKEDDDYSVIGQALWGRYGINYGKESVIKFAGTKHLIVGHTHQEGFYGKICDNHTAIVDGKDTNGFGVIKCGKNRSKKENANIIFVPTDIDLSNFIVRTILLSNDVNKIEILNNITAANKLFKSKIDFTKTLFLVTDKQQAEKLRLNYINAISVKIFYDFSESEELCNIEFDEQNNELKIFIKMDSDFSEQEMSQMLLEKIHQQENLKNITHLVLINKDIMSSSFIYKIIIKARETMATFKFLDDYNQFNNLEDAFSLDYDGQERKRDMEYKYREKLDEELSAVLNGNTKYEFSGNTKYLHILQNSKDKDYLINFIKREDIELKYKLFAMIYLKDITSYLDEETRDFIKEKEYEMQKQFISSFINDISNIINNFDLRSYCFGIYLIIAYNTKYKIYPKEIISNAIIVKEGKYVKAYSNGNFSKADVFHILHEIAHNMFPQQLINRYEEDIVNKTFKELIAFIAPNLIFSIIDALSTSAIRSLKNMYNIHFINNKINYFDMNKDFISLSNLFIKNSNNIVQEPHYSARAFLRLLFSAHEKLNIEVSWESLLIVISKMRIDKYDITQTKLFIQILQSYYEILKEKNIYSDEIIDSLAIEIEKMQQWTKLVYDISQNIKNNSPKIYTKLTAENEYEYIENILSNPEKTKEFLDKIDQLLKSQEELNQNDILNLLIVDIIKDIDYKTLTYNFDEVINGIINTIKNAQQIFDMQKESYSMQEYEKIKNYVLNTYSSINKSVNVSSIKESIIDYISNTLSKIFFIQTLINTIFKEQNLSSIISNKKLLITKTKQQEQQLKQVLKENNIEDIAIVTIEILKEPTRDIRSQLFLDVDMGIKARYDSEENKIIVYSKQGININEEEIEKMIMESYFAERNEDIIDDSIAFAESTDITLNDITNRLNNTYTDSVVMPNKDAKFDISNRKIGDITTTCKQEFVATGIRTFVITLEQATNFANEIKQLQEQDFKFIVMCDNSKSIVDVDLYNGLLINATDISDINQVTQLLETIKKKVARQGLAKQVSIKFSDDIYQQLDNLKVNIFDKYGIIPIIDANTQNMNLKNIGKTEIENITEDNVEQILRNNNVFSLIIDNARIFAGKKEIIKEINTKEQKYNKGYNASLNSKFNYTCADVSKLAQYLSLDINDSQKLKQIFANINLSQLSLSLDSQSYLEYLLTKQRYEEMLGFIRGITLNTARKQVIDKFAENGATIDIEKLKKTADGKYQKAFFTLAVQLMLEGQNITDLLETEFIDSDMTMAQYLEIINEKVNISIDDILKQNEYKITKLSDVTKAIDEFKNFVEMLDTLKIIKEQSMNFDISINSIKSILKAA